MSEIQKLKQRLNDAHHYINTLEGKVMVLENELSAIRKELENLNASVEHLWELPQHQ